MESIEILEVPVHVVTREAAVEVFLRYCDGGAHNPSVLNKSNTSPLNKGRRSADGSGIRTATPNAEILLEAQKNPDLKKYLQSCELNLADTVSLLWAGAVLKNNWSNFRAVLELLFLPIRKSKWDAFPETVSGSDFFMEVCQALNDKLQITNYKFRKIFLLGGVEGVAAQTKENLLKKYPNLEIVGAIAGSPLEADDEEVLKTINEAEPDILFLAYGCPKQELWIDRNLSKCETVLVAMGVGGTFDFVAGKFRRAPKFFRSLGLEWLWRLILQPSRMGRIFRAVFVFPFVFLKNR